MLAPLNAAQVNALLDQLPQRAQFAQEVHALLHGLQHLVNLTVGREPANAKPDTAVCTLVAGAQCPEHVAGLQRGRRACTPGRQRNVLQRHQKGLALNVRKRHVHTSWVMLLGVSVQSSVLHRQKSLRQAIRQALNVLVVILFRLISSCSTKQRLQQQ